jgi:hypothetical protein
VYGLMTVADWVNNFELDFPVPETIIDLTELHIYLYSSSNGFGASSWYKSISHTKSNEPYMCKDFKIFDILKVPGINTFLWFEELARKHAKPNGVSRSKLINTGLAV